MINRMNCRPAVVSLLMIAGLVGCSRDQRVASDDAPSDRPLELARPKGVPTQPATGPGTQPAILPATSSARSPATVPVVERPIEFPGGIVVDRVANEVRVPCVALGLDHTPLEFLCVRTGGPEHESLLRTEAMPSHIHAALLVLGVVPGSPVEYDEQLKTWTPPHGGGLRAIARWTDAAGIERRVPAERLVRSVKDGKPMPDTSFIFAGSHVRESDGVYLADPTGYVISLCNFEHTPIDVPRLVSSSNETLEWEADLENGPAAGTPVTLILQPTAPTDGPAIDPDLERLRTRRDALRGEIERLEVRIEIHERDVQRTPATRR